MILANLYNKVMGFFRQAETEEVESAKDTACNSWRVVLLQDRTNLTPELMDRMRRELVELLSKYVEMDKEALDLSLEQDGDQVALMLSIPVIRAKDEEEILAAIEEVEEDIEEDGEEDSEEDSEVDEASEETSDNETEEPTEETSNNEEPKQEEAPKPKRKRKKASNPEETSEAEENQDIKEEV